MNIKIQFLTILTLVIFFSQSINAQTVINKEWEIYFGTPDTIDIVETVIDFEGNLITTGNTIVTGQNANILTTKYDQDGTILWQQSFNYSGASKEYGTCITTDDVGNIYVAGASFINYSHATDYVILKYDTVGTLLWSQTYNQGNYTIDIPSDIILDSNGNIIVTGATANLSTNEDFLTVKLDNNGNIIWNATYDYLSLNDRPIGILVDNQNNVIVTGNSDSNSNNCDITTIKYDGTNGNELFVSRDAQICIGFDKPASIKKDNNNNIFITGCVANSAEGYNLKTIKYDANLNITWSKTYNGNDLDDKATSMDVDNSGNIIVSGYTTNTNNTKDIVTIKYDNNGNELWVKTRQTVDQLGNCETKKVKTDNQGNTYLLCEKQENSTNEILTIKYDNQGNKLWEKSLQKGNNEVLNDIEISNTGDVYLTTKKDNEITSTKISYYDKPMVAVTDSLGNPLFVQGEIIIRFDTSVVKKQAVDKVDLQYGNAHTFLKDTVIQLMNSVLPQFIDKLTFIKVFTKMTTADSISTTRLGEQVKISSFWTTFRMADLREGQEINYASILDTLYPIIQYSHINTIGTLDDIPNDNLITTQQESLIPTTQYPDAHINIEEAWNNEVGQDYVKVGIYDFPIYWAHEDFGDGTFNGSKIKGGWDYGSNQHISGVTSVTNSHGTSCAGIIGALRNNNKGIAGIAGGDVDNDNNIGVSLYSFGILKTDAWIPTSSASNAIIEGSVNSNTGYGYGLDAQSHSWGIELGVAYNDGTPNGYTIDEGDIYLLKEATNESFLNKCIFVASRGNNGNTNNKYPACFRDEKIINVGASGDDRHRVDGLNGDGWWSSSYGGNVDVIAPGVEEIVAAPIAPTTSQSCDINLSGYNCFNGTSSAAPHTAGVVSLMYSHHNTQNGYYNNLAPEDVENVLQKNTYDVHSTGYDDLSGWGCINAGEAVKKISGHYRVQHNTHCDNSTTYYDEQDVMVNLSENMNGASAGVYRADRFKFTGHHYETFSSDVDVIDAWVRHSSTNGLSVATYITNDYWGSISYIVDNNSTNTEVEVTTTTYRYHLTSTITGQVVDIWIPNNPFTGSGLQVEYSLHLFDPDWDNVEDVNNLSMFNLYPNPTNTQVNIEYELKNIQTSNIEVYNNLGQLIYQKEINKSRKGNISIDISNYQKGLYFVKFISNNSTKTEKLIIN